MTDYEEDQFWRAEEEARQCQLEWEYVMEEQQQEQLDEEKAANPLLYWKETCNGSYK